MLLLAAAQFHTHLKHSLHVVSQCPWACDVILLVHFRLVSTSTYKLLRPYLLCSAHRPVFKEQRELHVVCRGVWQVLHKGSQAEYSTCPLVRTQNAKVFKESSFTATDIIVMSHGA